jgi:hypothetical protein
MDDIKIDKLFLKGGFNVTFNEREGKTIFAFFAVL